MIRNRSGSSSVSPNRIFNGVRFVLFGFDSTTEAQYRSELVRRGGTDIGRYDARCTHVIISDRLYDDPVCIAAREDGKTLVTELWIDDSVAFGALADSNRVLYRPVKDLNGIQGSDLLHICLTGYQRQEREDIMKMVSLMGAHFTKPLIANQVTHLICYKFEGEKYELAKRVKIKLVNHRWLEDCLKAWEILPIDNYTKSGWELEISEAEAGDSEEETEDPGMGLMGLRSTSGLRSTGGASSLRSEVSAPVGSHMIAANKGTSSIQQKASSCQAETPIPADSHVLSPNRIIIQPQGSAATTSNTTENLLLKNNLSRPYKENCSGKLLDRHVLNSNVEFDHDECGTTARASGGCLTRDAVGNGESSVPAVTKSGGNGSTLSSNMLTKMDSSTVVDKKYIAPSRFQKTHEKTTPEKLSDLLCTPTKGNLEKKSELGEARMKRASVGLQSPASSALPQKRKLSVSRFGSKSPKSEGQESRISPHGTAMNTGYAQLEPTSDMSTSHGLTGTSERFEGAVLSNCKANEDATPSKFPASSSLSQKRKLSVSKTPKSEGQGSRIFPHGTAMNTGYAQLEPTSDMSMNHGLTGASERFEEALSKSKANEDATPSKFKSSSYKKRSFKRGQSASKPKDFVGEDFPSVENEVGLVQNVQSWKTLDNTTAMKGKVSSLQTIRLGSLVSPDNEILRDLLPDGEPREAMDVDASLVNTASVLKNLVIDGGSKPPLEKKTPETSFGGPAEFQSARKADKGRDIVMKDVPGVTAKETGQPHSEQLDDGILSPAIKNSYKRRLSSTASTSTCKENSNKETSRGHTKKVVTRRNLNCKSKLTTENASKDKSLATSESSNSKQVKPGKVGKVKAEPQSEKVTNTEKKEVVDEGKLAQHPSSQSSGEKKVKASMDAEKENKPNENAYATSNVNSHPNRKVKCNGTRKSRQGIKGVCVDINKIQTSSCLRGVRSEPVWFILSGHRFERKEFQTVIRRLGGKCCRDSHNWSYQATHFIVPDPVRRTEKFFAAAAAGRWILKTDYLTASTESGKFLEEEPFEWYRKGLTEDGAINLEAPRKWRLLRGRTGHGAFYGMRILIYGECIAPSLDTLKRVVKAGDGTILATSPPYTRFLNSGVDYVIISPSIPRVDSWVQEFLRHEIPCVAADYLVEYVCKAGYSLEKHVLYKTQSWAEKSFANLSRRSEEIVNDALLPPEESADDVSCSVCGSRDREEVMLICGDEGGNVGCGVGTHIECCDPPLEAVPDVDWFCPNCSRTLKTPRESVTPRKGKDTEFMSSGNCKK